MQAAIEIRQDGSVAIELDLEAARAMVASIVFAARFHEKIALLTGMVKARFQQDETRRMGRSLYQ